MPDFSRYATSQRAQLTGQAAGLPLTMIVFSAVALVVTSATVVLFGAPIADPVAVLARVGGAGATAAGLIGLITATLSTNIAANVVAPANAFVNLAPQRLSFRAGGIITAVLGMLVCPWRLVSTTNGFIFVWLVGYSALLGPVAGILLADYWLLRRRVLLIDGLFSASPAGPYHYTSGVNTAALVALAAGIAPNAPGFLQAAGCVAGLHPLWAAVYQARPRCAAALRRRALTPCAAAAHSMPGSSASASRQQSTWRSCGAQRVLPRGGEDATRLLPEAPCGTGCEDARDASRPRCRVCAATRFEAACPRARWRASI